jgi:hypothetical protein
MSNRLRKLQKKAALPPSPLSWVPAEPGTAHQFIRIGRYHRNLPNAEAYVLNLFQQGDPSATLAKIRDGAFRAGSGNSRFEVAFKEAVRDAREQGSAENLRSFLNGGDRYFVFTMGMSVDGEGTTMQLGFAGQTMSLAAPMRQGSIEAELTDDILEQRRRASANSLKGHDHFQSTAMYFRGYILSCCALVEAFLNRCVLIDVAEKRSTPMLEELQKPCNVERKFELWLQHFAGEPLSAINGGVEWDHYSELRRLRNSLMHATHSMLGISLKETARQLNLVRRGVGGMVNRLRSIQGLTPIPFAERLETAPECSFVSEVP